MNNKSIALVLNFFLFYDLYHTIQGNQHPDCRQCTQKNHRGFRKFPQILLTGSRGSALPAQLVQTIQRGNITVKLLHIGVINYLPSSDSLYCILNKLSGSVTERCRTVKHRCNKGIINMIQQQFRCLDLNVIVDSIVLSTTCQIILIFVRPLRFGGYRYVALCFRIGNLNLVC